MVMPQGAMPQEQQQNQNQQQAETSITNLWEQLSAGKGTRIFGLFSTDSSYYQNVTNTMGELNQALQKPAYSGSFEETKAEATDRFNAVLQAVDAYLGAR